MRRIVTFLSLLALPLAMAPRSFADDMPAHQRIAVEPSLLLVDDNPTDIDITAAFCLGLLTEQQQYSVEIQSERTSKLLGGEFYSDWIKNQTNQNYQINRARSYLFSRGYLEFSNSSNRTIYIIGQFNRGRSAYRACLADMQEKCHVVNASMPQCLENERENMPACRSIKTCMSLDSLPP